MSGSKLQLPGNIHVASTADELYDDLGLSLMALSSRAIGQRGVFHIALSGGSTPEPFYMRLVTDPRFRSFPWPQTHVWIVDERRVPESDAKSNIKMIREALLDHVPIRKRQIHPIPVMEADAARLYEEELARAFEASVPGSGRASSVPSLDWILLGMGDDAHTASLFPGSAAIDERTRWVAANDGPNVTPPPRLTMTYPLLNAGRKLAVLLTGAKKAATLKRVEAQLVGRGKTPEVMPITGIEPASGDLTWYLDAAAAGESI